MTDTFESAQAAEDAFYDALDEADLERLLAVWAESDDISCLLPMHPLIQGRAGITEQFTQLFAEGHGVSLSIRHLHWIESGDMAIHHVEERIEDPPADRHPPPPFYGTNIYRREDGGWRLLVHLNAPTPPPPPPEFVMPE